MLIHNIWGFFIYNAIKNIGNLYIRKNINTGDFKMFPNQGLLFQHLEQHGRHLNTA